MENDVVCSVLEASGRWSQAVSSGTAERIGRYLELLLVWNRRLNLTGAGTIGDLLQDHLPDSFALSRLCPSGSEVIDVGSGGGLPAVPFAILRADCTVTLVEPRAKRVAFLRTAARDCGCKELRILRARAEDVGSAKFSVASSRATFKPEEWVGIAATLVVPGGLVIVFSTRPTALPGVRLVDCVEYVSGRGVGRWAGCYRVA